MKYFMAVIGNAETWQALGPEETRAIYERMDVFNREMIDAGVLVSGAGLKDPSHSRTVRFDAAGRSVVTDGPFAEAKEQLAGYWVIECASEDEALGWATRAPMESSVIEVRPLEDEV